MEPVTDRERPSTPKPLHKSFQLLRTLSPKKSGCGSNTKTQVLRSFSTGRSERDSEFISVNSWFITGRVLMRDHNNSQQLNMVIIVMHCGDFKIVQDQIVTHVIPLSSIIGMLPTNDVSGTADESRVYGFKLSYTDGLPQLPDTFSVRQKTNRNLWMNALADELIQAWQQAFDILSLHLCDLKARKKWINAWVMVTESKRLVFYDQTGVVADVDLRRMRSLEWETSSFVLNHPKHILYIRISDPVFDWRQLVMNLAATVYDSGLETEMLNKRNVPIIVVKCLDYIFMHGVNTAGIYRIPGVTSKVTKLLKAFSKNPHKVSINPADYTEHDVASALRKYLRDLPIPVVGELGPRFYATAAISNSRARLEELKILIAQLSKVGFNTLREIVRHLYFVQLHQSVNRMSIENLAIIWGKCLLGDVLGDQRDGIVLSDMITHKDTLFNLADGDLNHDLASFKVAKMRDA